VVFSGGVKLEADGLGGASRPEKASGGIIKAPYLGVQYPDKGIAKTERRSKHRLGNTRIRAIGKDKYKTRKKPGRERRGLVRRDRKKSTGKQDTNAVKRAL